MSDTKKRMTQMDSIRANQIKQLLKFTKKELIGLILDSFPDFEGDY